MSRSQFVRNTMAAIQMQLQPHTDIYSARLSSSDLTYDDCSSSVRGGGSDETEMMTRSKRSNSVASWNSVSRDAVMSLPVSPASGQTSHLGAQMSNGSTQSVHSPPPEQTTPGRQTHGRAWEVEMENLLKVSVGVICCWRFCLFPPQNDRKCTLRLSTNKFCSRSIRASRGRLCRRSALVAMG
jgi:PH/SEC7 domain-containing protein